MFFSFKNHLWLSVSMHVYKYIYICISIIVNTKLYAQVDNLIWKSSEKHDKTLGVLALFITENHKHHDPNILEVLVWSFTWRHTVDGCKILHHQMDGWNPSKIMGSLPPTYQLVIRISRCHPPYLSKIGAIPLNPVVNLIMFTLKLPFGGSNVHPFSDTPISLKLLVISRSIPMR